MQNIFKSLNYANFKDCKFEDMNIGDIVMSTTFTHSQKYFDKLGFEDVNMRKIGILIEKNESDFENSVILKYDYINNTFTKEKFFRNPGSSGGYYLKKYNCD